MSRIGQVFQKLKERGEKALVAYVTAGDPDLEKTREIMIGLKDAGVDILEIGVPFSDPTADGPVIQEAAQRALKKGTTLENILDMIEDLRKTEDLPPVVLFGYYNPVYAYGIERFADRAKAAGVDGLLVVDLPPEEAGELRRETDSRGMDFISLIAPTTSAERIGLIARQGRGFLYYISITGVTGTARPDMESVTRDIARIRACTDLPLVVGFGISTPEQAGAFGPLADGIVIGSAFVRLIAEFAHSPDLVPRVSALARTIKGAMRQEGYSS
ncbi:MAG: Tryptophan synthase alpha chain [Syntrophus sp. PtaB.Bin138]|jgi:tryptophan synthase alpha chain|nr:MAG: Tryptophan synthase alpha chain [Syntrophus sp. PtaB.Bin138]